MSLLGGVCAPDLARSLKKSKEHPSRPCSEQFRACGMANQRSLELKPRKHSLLSNGPDKPKQKYLSQAVVIDGASSRQESPCATQSAGELGAGTRRRQRAGEKVAHDALLDAYLLSAALEHAEHQRYEPQ